MWRLRHASAAAAISESDFLKLRSKAGALSALRFSH